MPAAVRPVELDMLSLASIARLRRMFEDVVRDAGPRPVFWAHLGDLGDLACAGELERAVRMFAEFGQHRLAGIAPGKPRHELHQPVCRARDRRRYIRAGDARADTRGTRSADHRRAPKRRPRRRRARPATRWPARANGAPSTQRVANPSPSSCARSTAPTSLAPAKFIVAVQVYWNVGGVFQLGPQLVTGWDSRRPAIARLTGAALPDILVPNWMDGTVSVFQGHADRSFTLYVTLPVPPHSGSVLVTDVTQDGRVDLIAAGPGDLDHLNRHVRIYPGLDHGVGSPINLSTPAFPLEVGVSDLDSDGRPDLIIVVGGQVALHRALPGGGFAAPISYEAPASGAVALHDLTDDLRPDLVTVDDHLTTPKSIGDPAREGPATPRPACSCSRSCFVPSHARGDPRATSHH
ncbi:MAG TPA: VCBS repeat-containing protein [Kofleriaceae bacterium]|nr:VCBS repeat-containing protein [Kofleriaceae bacterium]